MEFGEGMKIPNPGSKAALKLGCKCPVDDNEHGRGVGPGRQQLFWVTANCKLHGGLESTRIRGWNKKEVVSEKG